MHAEDVYFNGKIYEFALFTEIYPDVLVKKLYDDKKCEDEKVCVSEECSYIVETTPNFSNLEYYNLYRNLYYTGVEEPDGAESPSLWKDHKIKIVSKSLNPRETRLRIFMFLKEKLTRKNQKM